MEVNALEQQGSCLALVLKITPNRWNHLLTAIRIGEDPLSEKNHRYPAKARSQRLLVLGLTNMYLGDLYGETGNIDKEISSYRETIKLAGSILDTFCSVMEYIGFRVAYLGPS